jgi:RNA polymerase sigma factor (sigma-70 family)
MTRRIWPDPVAEPDEAPPTRWRGGVTPDSLARALGALTPKQREAIELHLHEGLTQGQIARRLGITQQVVQKRLHGVRRRGKLIGGALPRLRRALGVAP